MAMKAKATLVVRYATLEDYVAALKNLLNIKPRLDLTTRAALALSIVMMEATIKKKKETPNGSELRTISEKNG